MKALKRTLVVAAVLTTTQGVVQAETMSEYIENQKELESLDFTIERMDRLVQVKEKQYELETVGQPKQNDQAARAQGQGMQMTSQMFRPAYTSGDDAAMESQSRARDEISEEKQKRQEAEQARLKEINLISEATIVEVFRSRDRNNEYGAVVEIDGTNREVFPGDMISHWKISQVTLNEITATNEKYDGIVRHIKQLR